MLEMVEARRNADKADQRYDLFSGLLDAAEEEQDDRAALSDRELVGKYPTSHCFARSLSVLGNMFIFLLAGHEVVACPLFLKYRLKGFPTDRSAYTMLHVCFVGSPPG